jgi:hypothetical protein
MCLLDFEDQVDVDLTVLERFTSHIQTTTSSDHPEELPDTTTIWFFVSAATWHPFLFHAPGQNNFQDSP